MNEEVRSKPSARLSSGAKVKGHSIHFTCTPDEYDKSAVAGASFKICGEFLTFFSSTRFSLETPDSVDALLTASAKREWSMSPRGARGSAPGGSAGSCFGAVHLT